MRSGPVAVRARGRPYRPNRRSSYEREDLSRGLAELGEGTAHRDGDPRADQPAAVDRDGCDVYASHDQHAADVARHDAVSPSAVDRCSFGRLLLKTFDPAPPRPVEHPLR